MIEKEELENIMPHRGKMLLLSRVNEYNLKERTLCAEYHVSEACIFYDPQKAGVPAWTGFEFIAQAISAYSGIRNREMGIKSRMGFILSIPFMRIENSAYKPGSCLEIDVVEKDRTGQIYTFEGKIFLEGRRVMEGKIMVMDVSEEDYNNLVLEQAQNK